MGCSALGCSALCRSYTSSKPAQQQLHLPCQPSRAPPPSQPSVQPGASGVPCWPAPPLPLPSQAKKLLDSACGVSLLHQGLTHQDSAHASLQAGTQAGGEWVRGPQHTTAERTQGTALYDTHSTAQCTQLWDLPGCHASTGVVPHRALSSQGPPSLLQGHAVCGGALLQGHMNVWGLFCRGTWCRKEGFRAVCCPCCRV